MTVILDLPPELEARLEAQAATQNIPTQQYVLDFLEQNVPVPDFKNGAEQLEYWKKIGFVGMWADRADIKESSEFARQLRRDVETRNKD